MIKDLRPEKMIYDAAEEMVQKVNDLVKKNKVQAVAQAGGSYAKKTNLKGDFDVDIFVRFHLDYEDKDISRILHTIIKPLRPKKVHGSRDYFQLKKKDFNFEFIPVLDVNQAQQAMNVTDCSPLHVQWFKKHGKGVQDEIRLAKMFCKAAGIYGAESYIRGFSGHTLDILIVHYGSFLNLLKEAVKWKDKTVIDPHNFHKGDALNNLNHSKIEGPLVVIDPIEAARNAASGLSVEKFEEFKHRAKQFLNDPSEDFFRVRSVNKAQLKKRFPALLWVEVTAPAGKSDVVGSKIAKVYEELKKGLSDFSVIETGWEFNKKRKAKLWFGLSASKRKKEFEVSGPPVSAKEHAKSFKHKHKATFIRSARLYAKNAHKHTKADAVAKEIIKKPYLKERITSCSVTLFG